MLNITLVAPVNAVPVIVTTVPTGPVIGVNFEMTGFTMNVPPVAVPLGLLTETAPVSAPLGTFAVIFVSCTIEKVVAFVPLKATAVTPTKCVPVIVTVVFTFPMIGVKPVIVG